MCHGVPGAGCLAHESCQPMSIAADTDSIAVARAPAVGAYERPVPAAEKLVRCFCALTCRKRRAHADAGATAASRIVFRELKRLCRRVANMPARERLWQLAYEWQWQRCPAAGRPELAWPSNPGARRRLLHLCVNSGWLPPAAAWPWIAHAPERQRAADTEAWGAVWQEFLDLIRRPPAVPWAARDVALVWLNGTPLAAMRSGAVVQWDHQAVRLFFSLALGNLRRTGREAVSRFEEEWWQRLSTAFPRLRAVRHMALPASQMHLDVFWPRRKVAAEIQGEPHWRSVASFGGGETFARRQERDARKRTLCAALGVALVEITPYSPVRATLLRIGSMLGASPRSVTLPTLQRRTAEM